ncbi:MAG: TIGR04086 family membrane protein [Clostridia bacterium]|nr:TIGR04086 family membrane protein [Clostridia bacterium]
MKATSNARQKASQKTPTGGMSGAFLPHILKSAGITVLLGLFLLLIGTLIAYFTADPAQWAAPLGWFASALTAFFGGWIAVRIHKSSALLCGLCNGLLMVALFFLCSLFGEYCPPVHSTTVSLLLRAGFLLLSILGAIVGRNLHPPQKKRRHH